MRASCPSRTNLIQLVARTVRSGEINPKAIQEVNIIFTMGEIAAQKAFEPCTIQPTDL
jgi:hypothetical protein